MGKFPYLPLSSFSLMCFMQASDFLAVAYHDILLLTLSPWGKLKRMNTLKKKCSFSGQGSGKFYRKRGPAAVGIGITRQGEGVAMPS